MEKVFELIITNPEKALTLLLLIVATSLFLHIKSRFHKDLDSLSTKMTSWEAKIVSHMEAQKHVLTSHSSDLGKATKAVNGDMLEIQKSVFNMKASLIDQLEKLKNFIAEIERNLLKYTEKSDLAVKALERIKTETNMIHSKIIMIDEQTNKTSVRMVKFEEQMGTTAKALKVHKENILKLHRELEILKKG